MDFFKDLMDEKEEDCKVFGERLLNRGRSCVKNLRRERVRLSQEQRGGYAESRRVR